MEQMVKASSSILSEEEMRKENLIIIILILLSCSVSAQVTGNTFAAGGPLGIYVALGVSLPSSVRPVNGGVAYLVERRISGKQNWQKVATVSAPTSLEEFRTRLEKVMTLVPMPASFLEIPVDSLWQIINKYGNANYLKFWSGVLPIRLASGIMYLDTTAQRDVKYIYRVSLIDQSGHTVSISESNVESYPIIALLSKLSHFEKSSSEKRVILEWTSGLEKGAPAFKAYRQDGLSGEFKPITPVSILFSRNDSTFYLIQDTVIKPLQVYKYYLSPMDYYGNRGETSDTVTAGTYEFQQVPLPEFIQATSLDSSGGILVSWHLRDPQFVRNLTIYKSTDYDTGYVRLSTIAAGDTFYTDQNVKPMVKYFYYLVLHGPLGESSPPSAKVFGMFVDSLAPIAPAISSAVGTTRGVRFDIVTTDIRQINYQVYRNDGFRPELHLVSGLVPRKDSITTFEDTSSALSGKLTYSYAVRAENASHVFSPFSDTAHVRPQITTHPPSPLGLTATPEGNMIQLYWEDMRPFDNTISGYFVYRREIVSGEKGAEFAKLNSALLPAEMNHYTDTTLEAGKVYEFVVRDDDDFGGESPMSITVQAEVNLVEPIPPDGIHAMATDSGILIRWNKTFQPNLREYRVYRYQRQQKPVRISTVRPSETLETLDKSVKRGNLYFYYLTAVNTKENESEPSQEVSIRK